MDQRKSGRRGNNEGTIVQLPNGKWRGRIMVGYLPNGKSDRRSVTASTRKEVQQKLRALVAQKETGRLAEQAKEKGTEVLSRVVERAMIRQPSEPPRWRCRARP